MVRATAHLREWLQNETKQNSDNTKCWQDTEKLQLSCITGGSAKLTATVDNGLAISYKAKPTLNTWLSNSIPRWCPREMKTHIHTKPCTQTDIYSSSIHNCPKLEATHMSFKGWTDKLCWVYTTRELSGKKNRRHKRLIYAITEWTGKKPVSKGCIYMIIYMTFLKRQS